MSVFLYATALNQLTIIVRLLLFRYNRCENHARMFIVSTFCANLFSSGLDGILKPINFKGPKDQARVPEGSATWLFLPTEKQFVPNDNDLTRFVSPNSENADTIKNSLCDICPNKKNPEIFTYLSWLPILLYNNK